MEAQYEEFLPLLRHSLKSRRSVSEQALHLLFPHKSYVLRSSRTRVRQKHMCKAAIDTYGIVYDPTRMLCDIVADDIHDALVLDIGFGAGETLVAMAASEPKTLFIGVETYKQGISTAFMRLRELSLQNIRFMCHDAIEVCLNMVGNQSFDRIQVFFPDPWMKKRHYKRRLLHAPFLHMCYALLKQNGVLWIVSDWQNYAEDVMAHMRVLEQHGFFTFDNDALHELETQRVESRFEKKGKERNHQIYRMVYRKSAMRL